MRNILCWLLGHRYRLSRKITTYIQELRCARCGAEFAVNHDVQALLPLDDELRELNEELLKDASMQKCVGFGSILSVSPLSIDDIQRAIKDLEQARIPELTPFAAGDYPELPDEMFKWMMSCKGVRFVGSVEDGEKMIARCKKLGLNVADPVEAKWPYF